MAVEKPTPYMVWSVRSIKSAPDLLTGGKGSAFLQVSGLDCLIFGFLALTVLYLALSVGHMP
jgi:hypothetical protein